MPTPVSLSQSRLGINMPLTNIAQAYVNPEYVMKILFPIVEVGKRGGQIIQNDMGFYEQVDDNRADDTPYPEIQFGYEGRPFNLDTKGLSFRVGEKMQQESSDLGMDWGEIATDSLMNKFGMNHEIRCAAIATTPGNYHPDNRIALAAAEQFNNANVDPVQRVLDAQTAILRKWGRRGNVAVMGVDVFNVFARRYGNAFTSAEALRPALTTEQLAQILGLRRVVVCEAISTRSMNIPPSFIMGKHMIIAHTNERALNADVQPYAPNGSINFTEFSMGYTYVYQGNPLIYQPFFDNDRRAQVYQGDFDRSVALSGVEKDTGLITAGYLISNAVA